MLSSPAYLLAGVLLAGIPILIHWLNRRRFRTIDWAGNRFLAAAVRKNRRRLRFERWLLLATRCAVLALLGLALARPVGCDDSALARLAGERPALHVILIDDAHTAAFRSPDDTTPLRRARDRVGLLLDDMTAADRVAVLTAGSPVSTPIAEPTGDMDVVRRALGEIDVRPTLSDLPGALDVATRLASADRRSSSRVLHLLTDGTTAAWTAAEDLPLTTRQVVRESFDEIRLYDVGDPQAVNRSVRAVQPLAATLRPGTPEPIRAEVFGFGTAAGESAGEVPLEWRVNGSVVASATPPPAGESGTSVVTAVPGLPPGLHVLSAALPPDPLPIDDVRHRVVDVPDRVRVLLVETRQGVGPLAGSGAFVELALSPPASESDAPAAAGEGGTPTRSLYRVDRVSDVDLGSVPFRDVRAVVLAGVVGIDAPAADRLRAFVEAGGALLVFGGEAVDPVAYNAELLPRGLLPGAITERVVAAGDPSGYGFSPFEGTPHPIVRVFAGHPRSGLSTARTRSYWRVEGGERQFERVLDFERVGGGTSDPAVTWHRTGEGAVVWVATSADLEWTNLPARGAYVTLLHEIMRHAAGPWDDWMNRLVGQELVVPSRLNLVGSPTLTAPDGTTRPMRQAIATDGSVSWRSEPLDRPGVYRLVVEGRQWPIAVNLPEPLGDVRPFGREAITRLLDAPRVTWDGGPAGGVDHGSVAANGARSSAVTTSDRRGTEYGWAILLGVLGLVAFESVYALRSGRG